MSTEERSGLEGVSDTGGKTTGGCASDSRVLNEEYRGLKGMPNTVKPRVALFLTVMCQLKSVVNWK